MGGSAHREPLTIRAASPGQVASVKALSVTNWHPITRMFVRVCATVARRRNREWAQQREGKPSELGPAVCCRPSHKWRNPRQHWGGRATKNQLRTVGFLIGGGEDEDRTHDLCIANAALSQLSYPPTRAPV